MRQFTCPKAVTHPSTNRARCKATAMIETNALPLHQTANPNKCRDKGLIIRGDCRRHRHQNRGWGSSPHFLSYWHFGIQFSCISCAHVQQEQQQKQFTVFNVPRVLVIWPVSVSLSVSLFAFFHHTTSHRELCKVRHRASKCIVLRRKWEKIFLRSLPPVGTGTPSPQTPRRGPHFQIASDALVRGGGGDRPMRPLPGGVWLRGPVPGTDCTDGRRMSYLRASVRSIQH